LLMGLVRVLTPVTIPISSGRKSGLPKSAVPRPVMDGLREVNS
jgi:hypothetical protein